MSIGTKLRYGCLFSGIGAPLQGAFRVYGKENVEHVFSCEWDKFARQSFKANYNLADEHFHTDINDMNGTQYKGKVDVIVGGSPCQDFSIAGLRAGVEGKRGQLIWQYFRIISEVMPQIFIYENVKGFVSDKNGKTLKDFLDVFRSIGYNCHWEVVNTKDFGVPQNRERIYIVGFLDADMYYRFQFAPKQKIIKRLRDVLEPNVDEKYYLSSKAVEGFKQHTQKMKERGNGFKFEPRIIQKERGFNKGGEHEICPTLTINSFEQNNFIQENYRIRKLTTRECLRLQDFPDTFKQVVSDSQMYKQAGNSMSVNILEMIFNQIELAKREEQIKGSLFN